MTSNLWNKLLFTLLAQVHRPVCIKLLSWQVVWQPRKCRTSDSNSLNDLADPVVSISSTLQRGTGGSPSMGRRNNKSSAIVGKLTTSSLTLSLWPSRSTCRLRSFRDIYICYYGHIVIHFTHVRLEAKKKHKNLTKHPIMMIHWQFAHWVS